MIQSGFLELVIPLSYFLNDDVVDSRQDIEDALDRFLCESGLGEVSGGGSGAGVAIIDIEVADMARLETVVEQVAATGRRFRLPADTRILQHQPSTSAAEAVLHAEQHSLTPDFAADS